MIFLCWSIHFRGFRLRDKLETFKNRIKSEKIRKKLLKMAENNNGKVHIRLNRYLPEWNIPMTIDDIKGMTQKELLYDKLFEESEVFIKNKI